MPAGGAFGAVADQVGRGVRAPSDDVGRERDRLAPLAAEAVNPEPGRFLPELREGRHRAGRRAVAAPQCGFFRFSIFAWPAHKRERRWNLTTRPVWRDVEIIGGMGDFLLTET